MATNMQTRKYERATACGRQGCIPNGMLWLHRYRFFYQSAIPNGMEGNSHVSESCQWINNKVNGTSQPNGYFNESYLFGLTEPGAQCTLTPCTQIYYGEVGYVYQSSGYRPMGFGTGISVSADNQLFDITDRPIIMKWTKRFTKKGGNDLAIFYKGCAEFGLDVSAPIPELMRTNVFVNAINALWFPGGPKAFRFVDRSGFITQGNPGATKPGIRGPLGDHAILTGKASVYFDYENAFTSPLQLFVTMVHKCSCIANCSISRYRDGVMERTPISSDVGFIRLFFFKFTWRKLLGSCF